MMMGLNAAFLGVALLLGGAVEPPSVTAGEFQGWFEAGLRGDLRIPKPVASRAKRFRYVFIGGFGIGRMPGYFTQNAKELQAIGIPDTVPSISSIPTPTRRSSRTARWSATRSSASPETVRSD